MKIDKKYLLTYIIVTILGVISGVLYMTIGRDMKGYRGNGLIFTLSGLLCIFVPLLVQWIFKIKLSYVNFIIYEIFILYTMFFCSMWNFYDKWAGCDIIAHTLSGVIFSIIIYELFSKNSKNNISYVWLFVLCMSFACFGGVLWEIFEYLNDAIRDGNMQKYLTPAGEVLLGHNAITDTMIDSICNLVGAILGASLSVFMYKKRLNKSLQDNKIFKKTTQ